MICFADDDGGKCDGGFWLVVRAMASPCLRWVLIGVDWQQKCLKLILACDYLHEYGFWVMGHLVAGW